MPTELICGKIKFLTKKEEMNKNAGKLGDEWILLNLIGYP